MKSSDPKNLDPRETSRIGPRQLKDPKSPAFAWQTLALMKSIYGGHKDTLERFEKIVAEAAEHRIYERIPEARPYGSMDAMLAAELGVESVEAARRAKTAQQMANADDVPAFREHGGVRKNSGRKKAQEMAVDGDVVPSVYPSAKPANNQGADSTLKSGHGSTNVPYLVRRLERDAADESAPNHPQAKDALARLRSGTLTSARAAGIAAGIVRVPTPLDVVMKQLPRLTAEERAEVRRVLDGMG